jgi:hypothetical protein
MKNNNLRFLLLIVILLFPSLSCLLFGAKPAPNANNPPDLAPLASSPPEQFPVASAPPNQPPDANSPSNQQGKPSGFLKADCGVSGISFKDNDITVDYIVDDMYDGPYLICNYSSTGSHGLSETAYFSVIAYKAGKLDEFYLPLKENIKGFVDQANEWNAQPDLPSEVKDEITFIRDDSDGYIFMITSESNVQGCLMGDGYGAEKINGKYLVKLQFSSCEGDAGAYLDAFQNLKTAAEEAIKRVEASAQP